eukprot:CAMPEP_0179185394 /NCGR_PEP_ID=MMETSP0796-20121207/91930_1 /TAXON_ID=73915 /ORGANISM="Pyrodinium bahamense, Strain pbaha01" /LENGTH=123 /DNA_ID=CAMNT_0020889349 /DNA_START=108 /DNA_END=479 /DNA_ORIENTATION=-
MARCLSLGRHRGLNKQNHIRPHSVESVPSKALARRLWPQPITGHLYRAARPIQGKYNASATIRAANGEWTADRSEDLAQSGGGGSVRAAARRAQMHTASCADPPHWGSQEAAGGQPVLGVAPA